MPRYSQAKRPVRVETTLGEDVLLLQSFTGEEGLSRPFRFELSLLSEESAISPKDVLRKAMAISVSLENGEDRYIHGAVSRFTQFGQSDGLTFYQAEIVPWLWFLSLSTDCKIFQDKDVLEIVEAVFDSVKLTDYDVRCTRSYPKREYCVQYGETHLDFVSRLLEEEGIFYFFEHSNSKHVLVLADDNSAMEPCPGKDTALLRSESLHDEDVVTSLQSEYAVHAGTVTLQDYDYEQPSLNLLSSISGKEEQEVYDYHPQRYTKPDEGERYARLHVETLEAGQHLVLGESTCRAFTTGYRFDLQDHFANDLNQEYTLVRITHQASAGDYRSWDDSGLDYRNRFVGAPHKVPYRPPREHSKPRIIGTQTAFVVGPSGEEVWTDKYGRVKVQFHWDREGKQNENSSCWVRVAQPWAGKGYGTAYIPRIGNEVVVQFEEGDPDYPIVTGSVYNAEQTPPFALPGAGIQEGIKSRSSKGGGGYNEMSVVDTKGSEQLLIHAQKDEHHEVLGDQEMNVDGNRNVHVKGSVDETIDSGETRKVTQGITETVTGDVKQTITGELNQTVTGGVKVTTPAAINMTAAGGVKIVAPAGVQVIAPGGHTQVDDFWEQTGSIKNVHYAESTTATGVIHAFFGMRDQFAGIDQQITAVKNTRTGLDMKAIATTVDFGATKIETKVFKKIAAALHLLD